MRSTDASSHSGAHDSWAGSDHYIDNVEKQFQLGKDCVAESPQIQIGVIGALKVEVYAIGIRRIIYFQYLICAGGDCRKVCIDDLDRIFRQS